MHNLLINIVGELSATVQDQHTLSAIAKHLISLWLRDELEDVKYSILTLVLL